MYNRIAVIYRGHLRTWNYVKNVNFQFFESISKHVDYYFVIWNLPYDLSHIEEDFKDKNLVKFLLVNPEEKYYQSDFGPPWHLNKMLPYKKEREKTVSYDAVFDTRPDIILKKNNEFPKIKDMTLYVEWQNEINDPNVTYGISDLCNIMSSEVFDIISQRYKQAEDRESSLHRNFKEYCDEHNIKVEKYISFCQDYLIRPQMLDSIPNPFDVYKLEILDIVPYMSQWLSLSKEQKISVLNRHNILLEDYNDNRHGILKNSFTDENRFLEKMKNDILDPSISKFQ